MRAWSLPGNPVPAHLPALGTAFFLHDLDPCHPAHLERLPVPADHRQAIRRAEGLRVVGGEHAFLRAYPRVLAPAGLVVQRIEGRRLGQEAVGVALGQVAAVHGGQVLLGRRGAQALEELRLAAAQHPDDGVVEALAQVEGIPVGGEQHLERALIALGQRGQNALQSVLAEILLHEREPRLEHGPLDLLHAASGERAPTRWVGPLARASRGGGSFVRVSTGNPSCAFVSGPLVMADAALFTDLYELTMAAAFLREGVGGPATFSLFARRLPAGRGFLVAAGLEDALEYLRGFRFTDTGLGFLRSLGRFEPAFLDHLRGLRFTGEVRAVPEGTPVFADEPLLEVTAPILEAQLVETALLNLLHGQTVLASKAARSVLAG